MDTGTFLVISRVFRPVHRAFTILIFFVCALSFHPSLLSQELPDNPLPEHQAQQTMALNPIFAPLGTITIEYERSFFPSGITLGISGWYEYNNVRARWIYVKGMYYPNGMMLRGFAFGITAGGIRYYREKNTSNQLSEDTSPMLGVMVQYNWYVGPKENILLGSGFGSRFALKEFGQNSPLRRYDGEIRLVLGLIL